MNVTDLSRCLTGHRRARPSGPELALTMPLREINGHLTMTDTAVMAWYRLKPIPWSFKSVPEWEQILNQVTLATAGLAGRRAHWRVTQRPYPISVWADGLDTDPRTTPAAENREAFRDQLARTQDYLRGYSLAANEVYVGVEVASRALLDRVHAATRHGDAAEREMRWLRAAISAVEQAMSMPGLEAVRTVHEDLIWLVHQSAGLHAPNAPQASLGGTLTATDIAAFTDGLRIQPDGDLTMVTATHARTGGEPVTRWVGVLSVGRMEPLHIPEAHEPWLAHAQALGFRVEVSAHLQYLTGAQARRAVQSKLHLVRDQFRQYGVHDLDAPAELEIVGKKARALRHDLEEGDRVTATQVHGVWRLAVSGESRIECEERIAELTAHYEQMRVAIEHSRGQMGMYSEFVPGALPATSAHTRRMPLAMAAAALPTRDTQLGDNVGDYLGYTSGVARPVMFDPLRAIYEGETTGLIPIIGTLGSGKSSLMAKLCYSSALRGICTTMLDPSGPLARLCAAPELAGQTHHVDLMSAPDGSLSPWTVIPTPLRANYDTTEEHDKACLEVQHQRRILALDTVRMLLPPGMLTDPRTDEDLMSASKSLIGNVATAKSSMFELILALKKQGEHGTRIATYLENMADLPMARLVYPRASSADESRLAMDATLVVLTMQGLVLPSPGMDPAQYSISERVAVPLLHLAAHLATRRIYSRPMWEPKVVALDELFWLAQWSSGRNLLQRLARDNRKWRAAVLAASQTASDVLLEGVGNLTAQAFVGRTEDPDAQAGALRLLRVPTGIGYEAWLGGLSPVSPTGAQSAVRQFVMRDAAGRVGEMVVDLGNTPSVAAAVAPAVSKAPPVLRSVPTPPPAPRADSLGWPAGIGQATA